MFVTKLFTMSERTAKRKLTCIFYADVAGYARLTEQDELGTHQRVMELLDYVSESVKDCEGNVLRYAGDAILAEFPSVVAAVEAAVGIQNELAKREVAESDGNNIKIRIGLNLGEVLQDRGEIYGDGVNLAARLEAAAEPGGICVSSAVYEQVKGKVEAQFINGGAQTFKNIVDPVRVYHWRPGVDTISQKSRPHRSTRPSLAVMRFGNMSEDESQAYFADGISDDLQSALAKSRLFDVVARNSTYAFEAEQLDPMRAGLKLHARYLVRGSVRRARNRVRVAVQLVDTKSGTQIWADRFDGELEDVFDLQDRITAKIASAVVPELTRAEIERTKTERIDSLSAWDHYLQALPLMQQLTEATNRKAIEILHKAIEIQHDFSSAYAMLSRCHVTAAYHLWGERQSNEIAHALEAAEVALSYDSTNALAYDAKASVHIYKAEHEQAALAAQRALDLDPSLASAYGSLANAYAFMGRSAEALQVVRSGDHVSPRDPDRSQRQMATILAYFVAGDYQAAIEAAQQYILIKPNWYGAHVLLAVCCALAGRQTEAESAAQKLLKILPTYTIGKQLRGTRFKRKEDLDRLSEGLKLAGLPET